MTLFISTYVKTVFKISEYKGKNNSFFGKIFFAKSKTKIVLFEYILGLVKDPHCPRE